MIIPSLTSNFVQIPESFLDFLIEKGLTRNELLICLLLAKRSFAVHSKHVLSSAEEIGMATELAPDAVENALTRAVDRGIVLKFEVEGAAPLYSLHTEECHVLAGYEAPHPTTAPIPVPPAPQTRSARDASPVLDRIRKLIGREMTKDEQDRMEVLQATEPEILFAIDNIEARKIRVYSSDQIIYEVESLQMHGRKREEEMQKSDPKSRAKVCVKCNGVGYLFVGVKSLRVCECNR